MMIYKYRASFLMGDGSRIEHYANDWQAVIRSLSDPTFYADAVEIHITTADVVAKEKRENAK